MNRRQVLGGIAGGGALSLSGCLGSAREEYPWPTVDEEALAGWDRLYERSDEYDVSYWGSRRSRSTSGVTPTSTRNCATRSPR